MRPNALRQLLIVESPQFDPEKVDYRFRDMWETVFNAELDDIQLCLDMMDAAEIEDGNQRTHLRLEKERFLRALGRVGAQRVTGGGPMHVDRIVRKVTEQFNEVG